MFFVFSLPAAWCDGSKAHDEEEEDEEDKEDSRHEVDNEDCPGEGEHVDMFITHRGAPPAASIQLSTAALAVDLSITLLQSHCQSVILSYCHTVILSQCHTVTLSHCHSVAMSDCHTETLGHSLKCQLKKYLILLSHHFRFESR